MGIEPTDHMISMRPNGFEDRDQHQLSKHFHLFFRQIPEVKVYLRNSRPIASFMDPKESCRQILPSK